MSFQKGHIMSQEIREKISKKLKGRLFSEETRERISLAKKGKATRGFGWKHSDESKEKMRKSAKGFCLQAKINALIANKERVGEKHQNWISDRTKLKISEKKHLDVKYMYWMRTVKNRDGWKCKILNSDCKGRLEAHHILNWVDYPELRYELNNGITLCVAHHPRKRAEEKKLSPYFMELISSKGKL